MAKAGAEQEQAQDAGTLDVQTGLVLLVTMGLAVMLIVLAVLLPIIQLNQMVR